MMNKPAIMRCASDQGERSCLEWRQDAGFRYMRPAAVSARQGDMRLPACDCAGGNVNQSIDGIDQQQRLHMRSIQNGKHVVVSTGLP